VNSILRILTSGGVSAFRKIFVPPNQVNAGTDLAANVGIGRVRKLLAREAVSRCGIGCGIGRALPVVIKIRSILV
jgi:hypothetical protein